MPRARAPGARASSHTERDFLSVPLAAQAPVCGHHRGLVPHPLQHGGGEEDLRGRRSGEVRGLSGGARTRAADAGSRVPLRQGKGGPVTLPAAGRGASLRHLRVTGRPYIGFCECIHPLSVAHRAAPQPVMSKQVFEC